MDAATTLLALLEIIAPTLGSIKSALNELYFSSVRIGRDCFDGKFYSKDSDEGKKIRTGFVLGRSMCFDFPHGSLQFHKKHSLLFTYSGFEFIMQEKIIPFSIMANNEDTWDNRLLDAMVKVRRSSGKVQSALLFPDSGLKYNREHGWIVKIQFFMIGEGMEPIHYVNYPNRLIVSNPEDLEVAHKWVPLSEFLDVNPGFRFDFRVKDPLVKHEDLYDEYVRGDADAEALYNSLSRYYSLQLQSYFEGIRTEMGDAVADKVSFSVYQLADGTPEAEHTVPRRTYAEVAACC